MTEPSESLTDIQSRNETIQTNISHLQQLQDDLKTQLDIGIANGTLTQDQINSLNEKINGISEIITNLYKTNSSMYNFFQQNIASTAKSLEEQQYATNIVKSELHNTNNILWSHEAEQANKVRLIEINNYYSEQYLDRTNIMKSIILVCIPLIIILILKNKGFLNETIFNILFIIIIVIGIIYLFKLFLKAISHNNMQYQQYDWNFNKKLAPQVDTSTPTTSASASSSVVPTVTKCTTTATAASV